MTAIATRPAHTITRRAAQLMDSGLDKLMPMLTFEGIDFDVEEHQNDYVLTVYRADDTVFVVIGYGVDLYDVARYENREWDDVHGEPMRRVNGVNRDGVVAILTY